MSSVASKTRKAGQYAQERAHTMILQSLLCIAVLLAWTSLSALAWGIASPRFIASELACCAGLALVSRRDRAIEHWQKGADGERLVGGVLESLHGEGWRVLHDISFGGANIDHVAIGPGGVFTVETKSHPGRIQVDRIDSRMLKQAWAEKKRLEEITGLGVQPLLVFSRAYLQGRVPCRRDGVVVLPARMLAGYLRRARKLYSEEQVQSLYRRLCGAMPQ
jgi:Nuclease-related domain